MKVSNEQQPDFPAMQADTSSMNQEAPEQSDINWFAAQLNTPPTAPQNAGAPDNTQFLSGIADSIQANQQSQKSALRKLEVASRSTSEIDFSRANSALSNYYIESLMNAKIISKGVQSLDKLTNLQ